MVANHQPVGYAAAWKGLFDRAGRASWDLGQPDVGKKEKLDNPVVIPNMLSCRTYRAMGVRT